MLTYVLLSSLLLSVRARYCQVSEIIRFTHRLLNMQDGTVRDETSVNCPCREPTTNSCLCLPIPEAGHELSCFVEGTERLLENNGNPKQILQLLNRSFQIQLERKFCRHLSRSDRCQSRDKGNVNEFLAEILKTYQAIKKSKA